MPNTQITTVWPMWPQGCSDGLKLDLIQILLFHLQCNFEQSALMVSTQGLHALEHIHATFLAVVGMDFAIVSNGFDLIWLSTPGYNPETPWWFPRKILTKSGLDSFCIQTKVCQVLQSAFKSFKCMELYVRILFHSCIRAYRIWILPNKLLF